MSQPFGFSCTGGLNTNLNEFDMLKQPGIAKELTNFEVHPDGGYRRVNGYTPFGSARPNSNATVHGVYRSEERRVGNECSTRVYPHR